MASYFNVPKIVYGGVLGPIEAKVLIESLPLLSGTAPSFFKTNWYDVTVADFTMSAKGKEMSTGKEAGSTNPRGIPYAPFVDKVEDYVSSRADVEGTLQQFQEMISKYQFMELNLQRRVAGLNDKMPDIQKTLETVRFLKTRTEESDPIETTFELNDTLYAKAAIPPTDEVYLWLGANVMLSYPIDEAETLLESKLSAAKQSFANCEEDLEFLREQITTMEVAIARVYNWDVVQKRKDKTNDDGKGDGKEDGDGEENG